jgi:hypothetical protein
MNKSRTNKSTIKNDPFATVIPLAIETKSAVENVLDEPIPEAVQRPKPANADRQRRTVAIVETPAEKLGKQKLTVHLESSLAERVKNAAYWNPRLTIAGIAEQGIRLAIERFEREHGGKYPPREGELIGGRPIK